VPLFLGALIVFLLTRAFDPNGRLLHLYSCAWAQLYFRGNPLWSLHVEGRAHLPRKGAAVIVANHESMGDILVLFGLFSPFKWVSKRSMFRVPLIGWNMWLNRYVGVERGNRASVVRMMESCGRWLDRGVPVLLFPEGTRSPDGQVQPFKDGAFQLALDKGCPIVPVVLTGTRDVLPKHGFVLRRHARCRVKVLEPVDPRSLGGELAVVRDRVRQLIIEEKRRLEAL
jgi:1-acyl-sn-glycerol-3-phosphate acyltransferase